MNDEPIKIQLPDYSVGLLDRPERYLVLYGGRGGTKSTSAAININLKCGSIPGYTVAVVREVRATLQDGALALIHYWADRMGIENRLLKNTAGIEYPQTGARVFALGAERNPNNLRGVETANLAWCEEASAISEQSFELLDPSMRLPGAKILITFNPEQEEDFVYKTFVLNTPSKAFVHRVNYGDHEAFRSAELDAARQRCLETDPDSYAHIWLGDLKTAKGAVFAPNKCESAPLWHKSVRTIRSWDCAATDGGGDYTVGMKLAMRTLNGGGKEYQIQDVIRGQWAADEVRSRVMKTAKSDGKSVEIAIELGGGEAGKQVERMWRNLLTGYRIHLDHPTGPKAERAFGAADAMNSGMMSYVYGSPWWGPLTSELAGFSEDRKDMRGRHDDQVDALAQAFNLMAQRRRRQQHIARMGG